MSDAITDARRSYLKAALEAKQALLDSYAGDDNGRKDLSRECQRLWEAFAGAGGAWADLAHVRTALHRQRILAHAEKARVK
jgi:hypothetical protein